MSTQRNRAVTKGSLTCRRLTREATGVIAGCLEDPFGRYPRQQLGWLGFMALPLLFPVGLPGMATTIGALSVLLALAVAVNRPLRLPAWLGRRNLPPRPAELLCRCSARAFATVATVVWRRWIAFTSPGARVVNGAFLAIAGPGADDDGATRVVRQCPACRHRRTAWLGPANQGRRPVGDRLCDHPSRSWKRRAAVVGRGRAGPLAVRLGLLRATGARRITPRRRYPPRWGTAADQ